MKIFSFILFNRYSWIVEKFRVQMFLKVCVSFLKSLSLSLISTEKIVSSTSVKLSNLLLYVFLNMLSLLSFLLYSFLVILGWLCLCRSCFLLLFSFLDFLLFFDLSLKEISKDGVEILMLNWVKRSELGVQSTLGRRWLDEESLGSWNNVQHI